MADVKHSPVALPQWPRQALFNTVYYYCSWLLAYEPQDHSVERCSASTVQLMHECDTTCLSLSQLHSRIAAHVFWNTSAGWLLTT